MRKEGEEELEEEGEEEGAEEGERRERRRREESEHRKIPIAQLRWLKIKKKQKKTFTAFNSTIQCSKATLLLASYPGLIGEEK